MLAQGRERRQVPKTIAAGVSGLLVRCTTAHPWKVFAATSPSYNPAARFEITVSEVEYRRNAAGRSLMARIYQPKGPGPFPTVLDLHGGAWNTKDRHAEE